MNLSQKHIRYWTESAKRNWKTAVDLHRTKHNDACLFFCHLTVEKHLKALVVKKTKRAAPYTHDLVVLARLARLPITKQQEQLLRIITAFNISGRYDDEKFQFYKKATSVYTKKYLEKTRQLYLWLQKNS